MPAAGLVAAGVDDGEVRDLVPVFPRLDDLHRHAVADDEQPGVAIGGRVVGWVVGPVGERVADERTQSGVGGGYVGHGLQYEASAWVWQGVPLPYGVTCGTSSEGWA